MAPVLPSPISISLSPTCYYRELPYQVLTLELTSGDRLIQPQDLGKITIPASLNTRGGVVISGRAPIWLYAYLTHELHPTAWVACYDPRLGAVVVATHSTQTNIGQVLPIDPTQIDTQPNLAPALLVVGPNHPSKDHFSQTLQQTLAADYSQIAYQKAHWEPQGHWQLQGHSPAEQPDATYAETLLKLRRQRDLVIVAVNSDSDPRQLPILEACSHYLIISDDPQAIAPWHQFCGERANLKAVGIVHHCPNSPDQLHSQNPILELTLDATEREATTPLPAPLLQKIYQLIRSP
ncbi:CRISPR-associated ring nuclease Crn3/Csx3 [Picosynechococcus sp. NKBG042902]|uniref:CRISPR-associated ring nuclease Crn3/Csx3 n=1 Tax=Picosynechococcus sp. NKBG042902 TaxID=490193 RepID=UPI0004A9E101|nr:CRISPR-associated ring nuclease Crn3/Csx3 [Picosynechococcus sp. NKBG042902]